MRRFTLPGDIVGQPFCLCCRRQPGFFDLEFLVAGELINLPSLTIAFKPFLPRLIDNGLGNVTLQPFTSGGYS